MIHTAAHSSTIIAIVPPDDVVKSVKAWNSDIDELDNLHVTLVFLGEVSDYDLDIIVNATTKVCKNSPSMHCKTQGLGVFDHDDEGGQPVYAAVDAVGMAELRTNLIKEIENSGLIIEQKYDFTPHMTLSYMDPADFDFTSRSPAVEWECDEVVIMHRGDRLDPIKLSGKMRAKMADVNIVDEPESSTNMQTSMPSEYPAGGMVDDLQSVHPELSNMKREPAGGPIRERMATQFGQSINEFGDDSDISNTDMLSGQPYHNDNTGEDVDVKLGTVEDPYSDGLGPMSIRVNDEEFISRGAVSMTSICDKISVALPDDGKDEDKYEDDLFREDQSIVRDPANSGPIYGK